MKERFEEEPVSLYFSQIPEFLFICVCVCVCVHVCVFVCMCCLDPKSCDLIFFQKNLKILRRGLRKFSQNLFLKNGI